MSNDVANVLESSIAEVGDYLPDEPITYKVCTERFERVKESLRILDDKLDEYNAKVDRISEEFRSGAKLDRVDAALSSMIQTAIQRELAGLQQWKTNGETEWP